MKKQKLLYLLIFLGVFLTACAPLYQKNQGEQTSMEHKNPGHYMTISPQEAKEMMDAETDYIILDVRTKAEFDQGHIPGAMLLPNENIGKEKPEELPELEKLLFIYCRSGSRSKQAAQKLAALGYQNMYEFGGIISWPYEITE